MEGLKTKTLAELYLKQGYLKEAYEIFQALAEKDPSDQEIRQKLNDLGERLGLTPPLRPPPSRSNTEKLRILEQWLTTLQNRRKND